MTMTSRESDAMLIFISSLLLLEPTVITVIKWFLLNGGLLTTCLLRVSVDGGDRKSRLILSSARTARTFSRLL